MFLPASLQTALGVVLSLDFLCICVNVYAFPVVKFNWRDSSPTFIVMLRNSPPVNECLLTHHTRYIYDTPYGKSCEIDEEVM